MLHFHCLLYGILHTRHVLLHRHLVVYFFQQSALSGFAMLDENWQKCLDAFLRSAHDRSSSEHTRINYEGTLRRFFREKHPEDMTRNDVEQFLHMSFAYRTKEVKPSSRNYRLAVISSLYKFAATFMVPGPTGRPVPLFQHASPTLGIRRAKVARRARAFTQEELSRFFAVIPNDLRGLRDRALFITYLLTARRASEIANLSYGDVFQESVIDADGTRRTAWLFRFIGKGKAGEWDVSELPETAKAAIDAYLQASGRLPTIEDSDPIFMAIAPYDGAGWPLDPYKPLTIDAVLLRMKRYCRMAGLDEKRLTTHSFRHTSAQMRFSISPNVQQVQHALRHQSIATTSIYLEQLIPVADPIAKDLEDTLRHLF